MTLRSLVLVIAVVLAGCGAVEQGTATNAPRTSLGLETTVATTPDLRFTASRSTMFDTQRTIRLVIENAGDVAVNLGSIQLDWPLYEEVAPEVRDTSVAPGETVLAPLPYGDVICGSDDSPPKLVAEIDGAAFSYQLPDHPEVSSLKGTTWSARVSR